MLLLFLQQCHSTSFLASFPRWGLLLWGCWVHFPSPSDLLLYYLFLPPVPDTRLPREAVEPSQADHLEEWKMEERRKGSIQGPLQFFWDGSEMPKITVSVFCQQRCRVEITNTNCCGCKGPQTLQTPWAPCGSQQCSRPLFHLTDHIPFPLNSYPRARQGLTATGSSEVLLPPR